MRSYHVATVAAALSCPAKWVDNILSRHDLPGVHRERQGVSRRVSFDALVQLAIVRVLMTELAIPTERAVRLAAALNDGGGQASTGERCALRLDVEQLRTELARTLRDAVEMAPPPRRGRPPRRQSGG